MLRQPIRAVFFDAVGTLIHPQPSAVLVYAQIGRRFGTRLDDATILQRFIHNFRAEEDADRAAGWHTSEHRELLRWRNIVARTLDDVADFEACFSAIYDHFTHPHAWRCEDGAADLLGELGNRGLQLGLASNFDHRLRPVAAGLSPLAPIRHLVISSEIGWRKPAPAFFHALTDLVNLPPESILLVGDDPDNDYQGGVSAGLRALLFDPSAQFADHPHRLETLDRLLSLLPPP